MNALKNLSKRPRLLIAVVAVLALFCTVESVYSNGGGSQPAQMPLVYRIGGTPPSIPPRIVPVPLPVIWVNYYRIRTLPIGCTHITRSGTGTVELRYSGRDMQIIGRSPGTVTISFWRNGVLMTSVPPAVAVVTQPPAPNTP